MVSDMHKIGRLDYMDLRIHIGQEVMNIERTLQDVVLVWD